MRIALLATAAALGLALAAHAQTTIFNDTFSSGTAAANGYYRFGTTNTSLSTNGSNLTYSYASGATNRSGFYKQFTGQSLSIGQSLTFSFTVDSRTLRGENHAFRWAIGNIGSPTAITGLGVGETIGSTDLAAATPLGGGTRQMFQFSASTVGGNLAGFGQFSENSTSFTHPGTATALTSFAGPASIATTGASTVTLTFTRTETGYNIAQSAFGTNSSGTIAVGPDIFNIFNTIAFSFNNSGAYNISLDNISVTTSAIPEPSTYAALAGIAALGLAMLRRRRRG